MSEKPMSLRERNHLRTRDEILIAASILMGERAADTITVEDIALLAGVSRGTIYTYFSDGRDQVVRDAYLRTAAIVNQNAVLKRDQYDNFTDRVLALAKAFADVVVTPEGKFYGPVGTGTSGPLSKVIGATSEFFQKMIVEDLEDLRANGRINADTPVPEMAKLLVGSIRSIGIACSVKPTALSKYLEAMRMLCASLINN